MRLLLFTSVSTTIWAAFRCTGMKIVQTIQTRMTCLKGAEMKNYSLFLEPYTESHSSRCETEMWRTAKSRNFLVNCLRVIIHMRSACSKDLTQISTKEHHDSPLPLSCRWFQPLGSSSSSPSSLSFALGSSESPWMPFILRFPAIPKPEHDVPWIRSIFPCTFLFTDWTFIESRFHLLID